jgi:hypothetical protein
VVAIGAALFAVAFRLSLVWLSLAALGAVAAVAAVAFTHTLAAFERQVERQPVLTSPHASAGSFMLIGTAAATAASIHAPLSAAVMWDVTLEGRRFEEPPS